MENTKHKTRRAHRRKPRTKQVKAQRASAFALHHTKSEPLSFATISDGSIARIKERATDLLSDHGIVLIHEKAVAAMKRAGATEGKSADRLRFPRELIRDALAATPKSVTLYGKSPDRDIALPRADGGFVMRTGTGAHGFVDPSDSTYRNLAVSDVDIIARVANGLDQVGFIAHPFVHGVPETISDIYSFAALTAKTDKHVWIQPYSKEAVGYHMRMAAVAAGGEAELRARPSASCIACSFSPLEFKVMDVEAIIQSGQFGLPIHACSLPSAGGTAPVTVPGHVLMATAEILAMVVLAHVLAPGSPVVATPLMFTLDMRTGSALQSCVESIQAAAMAIQVVKRGFGLIAHTYGTGSDTPDVDVQSLAERTMLGQAVACAGADILGGVGQLECATVFSPVQAVLDNEVGAMLRHLLRSPEVDDESLNWTGIPAVEPGGHFLDSPHTLKYCRAQFQPQAFLRDNRDDYEALQRRTAFDEARARCLELIEKPLPEAAPRPDAVEEIDNIVAAARRHILSDAGRMDAI